MYTNNLITLILVLSALFLQTSDVESGVRSSSTASAAVKKASNMTQVKDGNVKMEGLISFTFSVLPFTIIIPLIYSPYATGHS